MRLARLLLAGGLMLAPAGIAEARPHQPVYADPADVITAEIAFARLAKDKGLAAAMKATAVEGAQVVGTDHLPQNVGAFIKDTPVSLPAAAWQVERAWISCDASIAVTQGKQGIDDYITVWRRQKKGGYKWLLHVAAHSAATTARSPDDMINAEIAQCPARGQHAERDTRPATSVTTTSRTNYLSGYANDATLLWNCSTYGICTMQVKLYGAMHEWLLIPQVPPVPLSQPAHR